MHPAQVKVTEYRVQVLIVLIVFKLLIVPQNSAIVVCNVKVVFSELGMRQFFSFATMKTRQRNRASEIRKMLRSRCLNGVATTNISIMQ